MPGSPPAADGESFPVVTGSAGKSLVLEDSNAPEIFVKQPWKMPRSINSCISCTKLEWSKTLLKQLDGDSGKYPQSLTLRQREHRMI